MSAAQREELAAVYTQRRSEARRRGVAVHELARGARITIHDVVLDGGHEREITVAFSRLTKRVGDQELIIFRQHCRIPATATRLPENAPAQTAIEDRTVSPPKTRYFVGYSWREPA